jgi:major type 1 subunit fimbrin (pilin)
MREFNHFDFELNGIIRAFYALRLMISWIASTIFGVHYPLRNIRICQTVLRRRLPSVAEQEGQLMEMEATGAPQNHHHTLNQQVGSITQNWTE